MPKYEDDEKLPFVVVDSNGGVIARFAARHLAEEYAFDYNRYFVDTWANKTTKATVILFAPSGKHCTKEEWAIPENAKGPYDMERSPDFRRINGGAVLVDTQEPWGYPFLIWGEK